MKPGNGKLSSWPSFDCGYYYRPGGILYRMHSIPDPACYSGHSLRAGFATSAATAGVPAEPSA
jgi:hypothetical protein